MEEKQPQNTIRESADKRDIYRGFIEACRDKLLLAQMIRQQPAQYRTPEQNERLFGQTAKDYEHSPANPEYLHALGFKDADLLSVIYLQFERSLRNVLLQRPIFTWNKGEMLVALEEYFRDFDRERLQSAYDREHSATQASCEESRMLERSFVNNAYRQVLAAANGANLDFLCGYGVYVTPLEKEMCRFWFSLPEETLNALAEHIVGAFFHGFQSQSRSIAGRTVVRMVYAVGQEALAKKVVKAFGRRGMDVVVLKPSSIGYGAQYLADHRGDRMAFRDPECYLGQASAYRQAADRFEGQIVKTCGFVRIGTFGDKPCPASPAPHAFRADSEARRLYRKQMNEERAVEGGLLRPDTLSFCSVVFPDMRVGDKFREIFDAFVRLNTEESEPFERVQEELIDLLDPCEYVHMKGMNGNETDLVVRLRPLENKERETNFLNCGGDLNVPHGEIFTTPRLSGTKGLLHVRRVFLKGYGYTDLKLRFEDGEVAEYGCGNFDDEEENRRYVWENLLNMADRAPMGEMAIGTNTLAYHLAKKYDLFERLPILVAEKTGPHVAVGDPCFARGEDSPVYNLLGGREMVARDNERTRRRHENADCYVNFHTDITIPYGEMGLLEGIRPDGGRVEIIRDGLFVPAAAERLNAYLREEI